MKFETKVVELQEQPYKDRVAVMFFGRPGIYYAPAADRDLVQRLKASHQDGSAIEVEIDEASISKVESLA